MKPVAFTLLPLLAMVLGAAAAAVRKPGPAVSSAIQHFAAGVVFAAAASEILPDLKHTQSIFAILVGGGAGLATMLGIKWLGSRMHGPLGLVGVAGVDILIDGIVLGLGFTAAARQGVLLTVALTMEVLFLGLTMAIELRDAVSSRLLATGIVGVVGLLLPAGALVGTMAGGLPELWHAVLFAFALIALLYLVTEELLVEAHGKPDSALITSCFFVGFLAILILEEAV